jgi:hypothetical protein
MFGSYNTFLIAAVALSIFGAGSIVSTTFLSSPLATSAVYSSSGVNYVSNVCADVTRADGTTENAGCSTNFLTPAGRDAIMDLVAGGPLGSLTTVRQIALCNISTGAAGNAQCYGNQSSQSNGLQNTTGTFARVAPYGNWSVSNQFTATADGMTVNGTILLNGSSTGAIIFANNTFSQVTLNTNDQITIRWNISVS